MRALRRIAFLLIDLVAIVAVVACILHFCRRRTVACAWQGMRASCSVEAEDSLGRVKREQIDGIRGAAYRAGNVVGVVTDARNKDDDALFGTRMIELGNQADAERLYAFADDRSPKELSLAEGSGHPRRATAAWLVGLLAYAFVSRRARGGKQEPHV